MSGSVKTLPTFTFYPSLVCSLAYIFIDPFALPMVISLKFQVGPVTSGGGQSAAASAAAAAAKAGSNK